MLRPLALALLAALVCAAPAAAAAPITIAGAPLEAAEIAHWTQIAAHSQRPGMRPTRAHRRDAVEVLVRARWLDGEAALRDIVVSDAAVGRAVDERRALSGLADAAAYREFLQAGGMTAADGRLIMRLELLSNHLRERWVGGIIDPVWTERVLQRRLADFTRRWRSVTVCDRAYATKDCGRITG